MHYEFTESASESTTPPEPPTTNTTTRHRGIAAEGVLFHAINSAGVETKAWYSRVSWQDKRHTLSLGPIESRARELDRQARQRLSTGAPIDEVKLWLVTQRTATAAQSTAPVAPSCDSVVPNAPGKVTLRQVIAAHEAAYFDALPQTTRRYRASLLNLVETALRYRSDLPPVRRSGKRVKTSHHSAILDTPLEMIDETMVDDFKTARLMSCDRKSPQELSRKRSANTELRQAQCCFGTDARLVYKKAGLILPDMAAFLGAPRFRKVTCKPKLPPDATLNALVAGMSGLKQADPAVFDAVAMALYPGMRRNEILYCQPSWLQSAAGPCICIEFEPDFRPKNCTERKIPIPQWFFDHLKSSSSGSFLSQSDHKERDRILDRAVQWLRGNGFATTRKPLHALRGLYAAYQLATETNPIRIKCRLGHADLMTTFRYYADEPLDDRFLPIWTSPV